MSTLLHNLSSESILLMYLAGELPAEDRAEVEQMLAGDARLRRELEALRGAYDDVESMLRTADAAERVVLPAGTAARRVGQAVRSWHAWRLTQPQSGPQRQRRRFPTWAYPAAAAAALLFGYIGWWGLQPEQLGKRTAHTAPSEQDDSVVVGDTSTDVPNDVSPPLPSQDALAMAGPWGGGWSLVPDAPSEELDAAEADLYAMSESSGSALADDGGSILLMGETDER